MGRKSNRYMAETTGQAVAILRAGGAEALTEWNRSGNERADLTRHFWEMDPACVVCGLDTVLSTYKGEATAVMVHVVPPSLIPGAARGTRPGYIGGALGLGCRACADAIGAFIKNGGDWSDDVVNALDTDRFPCEWPRLDRTYRLPLESASVLAYVSRASNGHADAAREARRERGLAF